MKPTKVEEQTIKGVFPVIAFQQRQLASLIPFAAQANDARLNALLAEYKAANLAIETYLIDKAEAMQN